MMPTPENSDPEKCLILQYSERELIQRALRSLDYRYSPWPRWVRVKGLFGTSSEISRVICYEYGFDPDRIPAPSDPGI